MIVENKGEFFVILLKQELKQKEKIEDSVLLILKT